MTLQVGGREDRKIPIYGPWVVLDPEPASSSSVVFEARQHVATSHLEYIHKINSTFVDANALCPQF